MKPVTTKMQAMRLAKLWTQKQLSFMSRVAESEISRFENIRAIPYSSQAKRLAAVLGLEVDELQESPNGDENVRSTREGIPAGVIG